MLWISISQALFKIKKESSTLHLLEFVERMNKNLEYYKKNDLILANFKFLENIIDNWYR